MKKNESKVYLKVPKFDDLWYRKKMLQDPLTMEFNRGYNLDIPNYNYENGTIDFDETLWADWYATWVTNQKNFYAYIVRTIDDEYIGEVSYKEEQNNGLETTILLEKAARGFNYSYDALNLLAKEAFEKRKLDSLSDVLPKDVYEKIKAFGNAGYKQILNEREQKPIKRFGLSLPTVKVEFTKDDYLKNYGGNIFTTISSMFGKSEIAKKKA